MQSCQEEKVNSNANLELSDYGSLRDTTLFIDQQSIRRHLNQLIRADKDSSQADFMLRAYYANHRPFLWIDRLGADRRADSLLSRLADIRQMGFLPERFRVGQIQKDLAVLHQLSLGDDNNDINHVLARLEYNLTKAFLCYSAGQSFGFMNPRYALNHFDVKDSDSLHVEYYRLFDVPMRRADQSFFEKLFRKVANDSVSVFLTSVQPRNPLYQRLQDLLQNKETTLQDRPKILCNMERCRWRLDDQPFDHQKYVLVNIPAFRLYAVDSDSMISMRVGCGTTKTKTPLLTSCIKRMDVNPQWVIPRSIIEKDIVRHVGNYSYFSRHRYSVRNRKSGKTVPIEEVTWSKLMDKNYLVVQEGGAGNSLGRIIFRFDNNFSVFLHDTSSPAFFSRDNRGVSHGCVRVQNPFELAVFLLGDKDEKLIDKIHYSMTVDSIKSDTIDRDRLISSYELKPEVPVYLTYYTIYPDTEDKLHKYADIYGFDKVIYRQLKPYVE